MAAVRRNEKLRTASGAVLDQQALDDLAVEAERGYEPDDLVPQRVGRPSLGGSGPSPRVSFRATPDLYDAARRRADEDGVTISELARAAVARYLGAK